MGADGAESATAEAPPVHVHRVANHFVGRDALALIARVRQPGVGQVERGIDFLGGHGWVGAIHLDGNVACCLPQGVSVPQVALHFHRLEILGLSMHGALTIFETVHHHVVVVGIGQLAQRAAHHCLRYVGEAVDGGSSSQSVGYLDDGFLAHAIDEYVGRAVDEDGRTQAVLPVVVVRYPSQRCLDAAGHYRHVGPQPFQCLGIDDGGVVGAGTGASVGGVSIIAAPSPIGRVMVHHRVHGAGMDAEKQPWAAQFFEVAQVVAPVGLRHDGYVVAMGFKHTADDGSTHRRVVDIGVAGEQDHVGLFPAQMIHLLACGGQPLCINTSHIQLMGVIFTQKYCFFPDNQVPNLKNV